MNNKRQILLTSSLLILPFTFGLFQLTTLYFGPKWGYISGFAGYWAYCLSMAWLVSVGSTNYFRRMWMERPDNNHAKWFSFLAFIPAFGVFFVSLLPYAAKLTFFTGLLLVTVVLLNGSIEELYWRGLYLLEYPDNARIGFLFSWFLFGAWHVSL